MARSTVRVRTVGSARGFSYKYCMCGRLCRGGPGHNRQAKKIRNRAVRRDAARHIEMEQGARS